MSEKKQDKSEKKQEMATWRNGDACDARNANMQNGVIFASKSWLFRRMGECRRSQVILVT